MLRMKVSLNPWTHRYHFFRGLLVQPVFALLFFLAPVFDVFRVDMIHSRLIFLRQSYPFEFRYMMWLPVAFYGGVILVGIVSVVWGRLFCGWVCPHNTLSEWTRPFRAVFGREEYGNGLKKLFRKFPAIKFFWQLLSFPLAIWITFKLSVLLSAYVVPMSWIQAQYASHHPHIALVWGNGLFALIGMFMLYCGHDFCRTSCPYGMLQAMSAYQEGKWMPMEVRFAGKSIEADCKTCTACQQICPVQIDPRKPENLIVGVHYGCFNCGECIDACKQVHEFKKEPGILNFRNAWQSRRLETAEPVNAS